MALELDWLLAFCWSHRADSPQENHMKNLCLTALFLGLWIVGPAPAKANDIWTPYVTIINLSQTDADSTAYVYTYPYISGAGCTGNDPAPALFLQTSYSPYPSYASISPYIMAAFLNNKQVSFHVVGCTTFGTPVIAGVRVQQ
jgi:hypothetical protein